MNSKNNKIIKISAFFKFQSVHCVYYELWKIDKTWFQGIDITIQQYKMSTFEFWLELAWLGTKCIGKTLLIIEILFTLHRYCTVKVQYWCSVSKAKHDQVFSAAFLNGHKIQISLQLQDPNLTGCKYGPLDFNVPLLFWFWFDPSYRPQFPLIKWNSKTISKS